MNIGGYGFHFEEQGRSGEEGPIDPAQQYFEGSHADHAVVRETGQNTLDNRGTTASGPIRMEFELVTMATGDIPGIEDLRKHLDAVADQTAGQQGHDRMVRAAALARESEIKVLRISDYNTTGLTGSESLASKESPISRLTRGQGGSADDGVRGGSFGIGSAVGPMASELSTVLYTSLPEDGRQSVLAGYTRLATHALGGTSFRAEGYYTRIDLESDFEYPRPAPPVGPFGTRTESGTDIYIVGYRMSDERPELERVRDAVIDNFMAAISRGRLVVEGIAPGNRWRLDADTLEGFAKRRPQAYAFYVALQDPNPAEGTVPHVGKVRLYVNIDDRLERKLHTITMRAPLMRIDTFRHNSISAKYAAVLVCDEPEGNTYLRGLEPPQHHVWDGAREPVYGKKVVDDLKKFTREALRERITVEIGDEVKIDGLARFLPTDSLGVSNGDPAVPATSSTVEGTDAEASSVVGDPADVDTKVRPPGKKVRIKVRRPAVSDADGDEVEAGKKRGGKKKRKGKGGPLPDEGSPGDGTARIRGRDVRFRSWSGIGVDEETAVITVALTAAEEQAGDLTLVALGPGGAAEPGYDLPIMRAVLQTASGTEELEVVGNTLKGLVLPAATGIRVDIHVPAGERYRLEAL